MTNDELTTTLKALYESVAAGVVQFKYREDTKWMSLKNPYFDFRNRNYRIKPTEEIPESVRTYSTYNKKVRDVEVMQAAIDGKVIERRTIFDWNGPWVVIGEEAFNFDKYEYRIQPETPKPKEIWVNPREGTATNPHKGYNEQRLALLGGDIAVLYREVIEETNNASK